MMEFDYDSGELGEIDAPDFTQIQTPGLSHAVKQLDCYIYNDDASRWQKHQQAHQSTKGQKTLSFLSWNMWFGKAFFEARINEVAKNIELLNPDVVALQQATGGVLCVLLKSSFIRSNYYLSDVDGSTLVPSGVLFLAKFAFSQLTLRPLISRTGRELLMAKLRVNKADIWINGACLESPKQKSQLRLDQAKSTNMKIAVQDNCFLLLSANNWGAEEQKAITDCYQGFEDSWIKANPQSKGFTIDTSANPMINQEIIAKGGIPQRRHDRADFVLYKGQIWHPISAKLVGTAAISISNPLTKSEGTLVDSRLERLTERSEQTESESESESELEKKSRQRDKILKKSSQGQLGTIHPSNHFGVFVEFSL